MKCGITKADVGCLKHIIVPLISKVMSKILENQLMAGKMQKTIESFS